VHITDFTIVSNALQYITSSIDANSFIMIIIYDYRIRRGVLSAWLAWRLSTSATSVPNVATLFVMMVRIAPLYGEGTATLHCYEGKATPFFDEGKAIPLCDVYFTFLTE
jgi:hypothetical protein